MTETQYRTHFNLWAIFKAPLLIGCDVRNMTPSTRDVLLQTAVCVTPHHTNEECLVGE